MCSSIYDPLSPLLSLPRFKARLRHTYFQDPDCNTLKISTVDVRLVISNNAATTTNHKRVLLNCSTPFSPWIPTRTISRDVAPLAVILTLAPAGNALRPKTPARHSKRLITLRAWSLVRPSSSTNSCTVISNNMRPSTAFVRKASWTCVKPKRSK